MGMLFTRYRERAAAPRPTAPPGAPTPTVEELAAELEAERAAHERTTSASGRLQLELDAEREAHEQTRARLAALEARDADAAAALELEARKANAAAPAPPPAPAPAPAPRTPPSGRAAPRS